MLNSVEYENSFITSGPECISFVIITYSFTLKSSFRYRKARFINDHLESHSLRFYMPHRLCDRIFVFAKVNSLYQRKFISFELCLTFQSTSFRDYNGTLKNRKHKQSSFGQGPCHKINISQTKIETKMTDVDRFLASNAILCVPSN